ncbi:TVP38/TMEM64 family protein [Adhaeribacter sp. BT258]|uniref:TVP38/TMEM64 family membrane protein n=1 Tax=Adhaeribacter terrigena TaxID=2793070 RepID=A0ABS1C655_9BACT|nr:VTT domain-containing protein [Adhaeribacter terrigena]MBK0404835.1 TVP38/TMEM64 family protein [Adhaeribacter terrigena]
MPINAVKQLYRENRSTLVSLFLLIAVPVAASSALIYFFYEQQEVFLNLNAWQMLAFFMVASFTMAFAFTPTTFIALISGFFLGWVGFPGVVISYGVAAFIGYLVAQRIDHGRMTAFINHFPKAALVMDELKHHSWELILLARISPVLPFAFMTFVLSIIRVPLKKFLIASMAGMLPRTLFFFWVGTQASNLLDLLKDPNEGVFGKVLLIGLIVISLFGLYYLLNNAIKKALKRSSEKNMEKI